MGHDCSVELDACLVGSDAYEITSLQMGGDDSGGIGGGQVIPPGFEACATAISAENKCKAHLGTTSYSCQCGSRFVMDQTLPFDNCKAPRDPCASIICIEGMCISSAVCSKYFMQFLGSYKTTTFHQNLFSRSITIIPN